MLFRSMCKLKKGDSIQDLVVPLGKPTDVDKIGTIVLVGGGLGIAPLYPLARAFKQAGNNVICIIGARNKSLVFWEDKLKTVSDEVIVTTNDGSYGRKGLVTEALKEVLDREMVERVYAIGPVIMMKFVALESKVKTIASLNPIMVDGLGMCGACRVNVGGEVKFACVDGPEFDAHKVDFDELMNRNTMYDDVKCRGKCKNG